MKKKQSVVVIVAVTVVFAVIAGIVYISLKNEEALYDVEFGSRRFIRTFHSPFDISDDISGNERVDTDGKTTYFKPKRNIVSKNEEVVNGEKIKTKGWAVWGLQAYGLRADTKYKMIINMAIDSIPDDIEKVIATINTHPLGIQGGHHICLTPNDNTFEIKASDFDSVNEFKEIAAEFTFHKFAATDMVHNHEGKQWEDFNGLYMEGALELRVGWINQKVGIKIKEIRLERVD